MGLIISRSFAVAFLYLAFAYLGAFPVAKLALLAGAALYLGVLVWRPSLWLILVPALLPLLYLAPWSGRTYFDEFDVLVMLTLSATMWRDCYRMSWASMTPGSRLILLLFLLVYVIALVRGLWPLSELDTNAVATYYSSWNALRVAKGLVWAILLYPAWVAQRRLDRQATQRLLTTGLSLGALFVFLIVLWERNVFQTLIFWTNKYAPIQALLNFSTEYRVTAMFADMHTGGTAIDGFLLLVLPFVAMAFLGARGRTAMIVGAILLLGVLYASMTTFSRGVYLGVGVAILASAFLVVRRHRYILRPFTILTLAFAFGVLGAVSFVAFRAGGMVVLSYTTGVFLAAAAAALYRQQLKPAILVGGMGALSVLLIGLATWSIATHEYPFVSAPPVLLAVIAIVGGCLAGFYVADRFRLFLQPLQVVASLVAFAVLVGLLTPSLFGARMETRFATVKEDLLHRVDHWRTAVEIMDDDWPTLLFGQGLGRFPETYFWKHQSEKDVGGFVFQREDDNQFVRLLGAKDVRLGQRLSLAPKTNYVLSLDVRTDDKKSLLYLRACHRQLIHPYEYNPLCVQLSKVVTSTDGQWKHLEIPFNTKGVGKWRNTTRAPLVFIVTNRRATEYDLRPQTALHVDNVSIVDASGREHLVNGDFEAGIDRWFSYYDFNHLPWHIKNIWVHIYFETGLLGLGLFVLLLLKALGETARAARDNEIAFAIFVALTGFMAVGSFGTLIDSPRIALLFYFLLLLGLAFGSTNRKAAGAQKS